MAKKRKRRSRVEPDSDAPPQGGLSKEAVGTPLGALLKSAGLGTATAKPPARTGKPSQHGRPVTLLPPGPSAPSLVPAPADKPRAKAPLSTAELAAWNQAYRGVAPLTRPKRGRVRTAAGPAPVSKAAPDPAQHARLEGLVTGSVRFELERDGAFVRGVRKGSSEKVLRRLESSAFHAEATLDLHGKTRAEAERSVHDFVRSTHKRGARYLLVIPGKGEHSEGGVGVLGEAVVQALTRGGAAPLVLAFASAHRTLGGSGALAVQLL
jgi:DNA-nicking Smr family endonuclease